MTGSLFYWVADWSLSRAQAAARLHGQAADMVDCTHDALPAVRPHLGGPLRRIAGYITGTPGIDWTPEDEKSLPAGVAFERIDQSNQNLPESRIRFVAKDVEQGASSIPTAVEVAGERIHAGRSETIYIDASMLPALEEAVAHAGLPAGRIIGYQYASPSSNPGTPLPGSQASLQAVNADLSVVEADWLPLPGSPAPPPSPHDQEENAEFHKWWGEGFHQGYREGTDQTVSEIVQKALSLRRPA